VVIFTARILAWALHVAARGLSQQQIEHEILNSRDLSRKGPASRRLTYAERTAVKAISVRAVKEPSLRRKH
jgi:hypothetical protein